MHDKMSTSLLTVYPDISTVEEIDHAVLEEMLALEYIVAGEMRKILVYYSASFTRGIVTFTEVPPSGQEEIIA